MSCLPDLSQWSWGAKRSFLEAHFEAIQAHVTELAQELTQQAPDLDHQEQHYRELIVRIQESLEVLHELRKHPQEEREQ